MSELKRRTFLKTTIAAAGSVVILPARVWANPPSGRISTAHIGIGGKGWGDLHSIARHQKVQVVGLCDVDTAHGKLTEHKKKYGSAKFFKDYREMLGELGDKIDAVGVCTPDFTHYPATLMAMNAGKHVYTQKPLVHKIAQARHLAKLAKEKRLVTSMGIQCHSMIPYRISTHFIQQGVIGKVSKVHVWSNKTWGYDGAPYKGSDPVPETLDWDLWQGDAPKRPFLKGKYHPSNWRKMLEYGCGTLGDMGVHIFDTPFRALKLSAPQWVEVKCRAPTGFGHPTRNIVRYGFTPTELTTRELVWTWYDGGYATPKDEPDLKMPEGRKLPKQGAMFVGEKGRMLLGHISGPQFFPESIKSTLNKPKLSGMDHYLRWVDGIVGKGEAGAPFSYAGPLTEALLLGTVGARYPGKRLTWDAEAMEVTNLAAANRYVGSTPRPVRPAKRERPARSVADGGATAREKEAERLFRTAQQAERLGQRPAARGLYKKIVSQFEGTPSARKAADRLKAIGQ
jgi:predicted dehydrogenase